MKFKKIIILPIILFLVSLIYILSIDKKINYIALGDSLVEGLNPYNQIGYSYSDYLKEYFLDKNKLKFYTKDFAKSGYTSLDLLNDIKNNKEIIDGKTYNIKRTLRNSDLVTISIGSNDFIKYLNLNKEIDNLEKVLDIYNSINKIFINIDNTIKEIKKYAKETIIIVGYYNPYPNYNSKYIDEIFNYIDHKYNKLAEKNNIYYISIYNLMKSHPEYLPNPENPHPNLKGYEAISNKIISFLEENDIN